MDHVTFSGRTLQSAQNDGALFADPAVLLRIIHPQGLRKFPEEDRVELAHRLHLVVRHGQGRIDGPRRSQEAMQDLQLISRPGALKETEDAEGNGHEVREECQGPWPRRTKNRLDTAPRHQGEPHVRGR